MCVVCSLWVGELLSLLGVFPYDKQEETKECIVYSRYIIHSIVSSNGGLPPRCPPRAFIPALCKIFMDPQAPDNILEVTARALTYYLDVSVDCTRRIIAVDGALKAIIERMQAADIKSRTSKDLAEQCVKVSVV